MQTLVTKRESTAGKSEMYPEMRRPTVLVMPIIDKRKEAVSLSISCKVVEQENIAVVSLARFTGNRLVSFVVYLRGGGVNDVNKRNVEAQHAENVGDADEKEDGIFH